MITVKQVTDILDEHLANPGYKCKYTYIVEANRITFHYKVPLRTDVYSYIYVLPDLNKLELGHLVVAGNTVHEFKEIKDLRMVMLNFCWNVGSIINMLDSAQKGDLWPKVVS